jgi:cytochrome oxidase assembly protein ShyY1
MVVLTLIALVVAGVCVRLGVWQLHRLSERKSFNAEVRRGLALPPLELELVLPAGDTPAGDDLAFRPVTATGTYEVGAETILYGRTNQGRAGSDVLTPLQLGDGRTVIVDRGWVPADAGGPPVAGAEPPRGTVTVDAILLPFEARSDDAAPVSDTIAKVDLGLLSRRVGAPLLPMYVQLRSQSPPQPGRFPVPGDLPELGEGPHFSYAIQWFSFATIALVGCAVLLRRELNEGREEST